LRKIQFPASHEEAPQNTGKTGGGKGNGRYRKHKAGGGKSSGRYRKRAAARQTAVTEIGRPQRGGRYRKRAAATVLYR
jgi:hypothetical protein